MIIHDPNLMRLAVNPFENHPPSIVDPDRVKVLEAALELFQPVRRRYRQILQPACRIDSFELPLGNARSPGEPAYPFCVIS